MTISHAFNISAFCSYFSLFPASLKHKTSLALDLEQCLLLSC